VKVVLADVPMAHLKGEAVTESPNLGILYIISYARDRLPNVEFHYLDPFLNLKKHLAEIKRLKPDVYGVSFTTPKKPLAFEAINHVKKVLPNVLVVAGGPHPTIDAKDVFANSETDICVIGEGEETFVELLKALLENKELSGVDGITYRDKSGNIHFNPLRKLIEDIDFLPAWDIIDFAKYDGPVRKKHPFAYVLPSRGCPAACTFCSSPVWKLEKPWVRLRSPQDIAEEVKYLYNTGVREIYIRCDTFNVNLDWAISVCEEIEKLNLKDLYFQCNLRSDKVNEKLAEKLKNINCWLVHIGIESVNNRVLKGINKMITFEDTMRTLHILKKYKIKVYGFFMLYNAWEENGVLQYETTEEVLNTLSVVKQLLKDKLLAYISWSITNPIVGSELHEIAVRHDIISENKYLPLKLPIPEEEMRSCLKEGLMLQLWNGIENNQINRRSMKRVMRKIDAILEL
jgi:anaerobic magnesium-protoporphyrin IX monomethyl ester cyclase